MLDRHYRGISPGTVSPARINGVFESQMPEEEEEGDAQTETPGLPHNYYPLQRTLLTMQVETCATASAKYNKSIRKI